MSPCDGIDALDLAGRDRFRGAPFFGAEWTRQIHLRGLPCTTFRPHTPGGFFISFGDRVLGYRGDRQGD